MFTTLCADMQTSTALEQRHCSTLQPCALPATAKGQTDKSPQALHSQCTHSRDNHSPTRAHNLNTTLSHPRTHLQLYADAAHFVSLDPVAAYVVAPSCHKVVGLKGREAHHTHVVAGHTFDQQLGLRGTE